MRPQEKLKAEGFEFVTYIKNTDGHLIGLWEKEEPCLGRAITSRLLWEVFDEDGTCVDWWLHAEIDNMPFEEDALGENTFSYKRQY